MSLVDGHIITDGMDIVRYLDTKFQEIAAKNDTVTGIVIGTAARKALSVACQRIMGQSVKSGEDEVTVNRYKSVLLIEDGNNLERIEVISGHSPILPVESSQLLSGLRAPRLGQRK